MTTSVDSWAKKRLVWPYRVGHSWIHGVGAIATRHIARGELVPIRTYGCLEGFGGFNHSCDYNLTGIDGDPQTRFRRARRAISPGEELTLNYLEYFPGVPLPFARCNCPNCWWGRLSCVDRGRQ